MSQGFFEMLWDCDHCEMRGLLGKSQRHCPECGAKQNPDKRYFPKEGEQRRIDGHRFEGADRHCPACEAPQSVNAKNCTNCGSPQDGAREVRGVVTAVAPKPKSKLWLWAVLGLGAAGTTTGVVVYKTRTVEQTVVVTEHRWQRSIGVEQFGDTQEEKWRNEVPSDARSVSCRSKQRTSHQVRDGETCKMEKVDKKDGTFQQVNKCKPKFRSEPVMDDSCSYTVRRWKQIDAVKLAGTGLTPAWPTAGLPPEQYAEVMGAKRAGKKTEELTLVFGKQMCEGVPDEAWRKYADGAKVKVTVRSSSGDIVCSDL